MKIKRNASWFARAVLMMVLFTNCTVRHSKKKNGEIIDLSLQETKTNLDLLKQHEPNQNEPNQSQSHSMREKEVHEDVLIQENEEEIHYSKFPLTYSVKYPPND